MKYATPAHSYIVSLIGVSCSGAVLLRGGGVDVLSGQRAERLKAALEDVVGRVAAASAQRQEAKELSAAHQQKRDRVVQACSMLKVWAKGNSVCVHVWPTPQTYRCVMLCAETQPGPAAEGEAATAGVPRPQEEVGGGGHPSPGYYRPVQRKQGAWAKKLSV